MVELLQLLRAVLEALVVAEVAVEREQALVAQVAQG
jgi:hypothetical protein